MTPVTDYRLSVTSLPPNVLDAYKRAVDRVPLLARVFGALEPPNSAESWRRLPTTDARLYGNARGVLEAICGVKALHSPAAPLDLGNPQFPWAVLQSYGDRLTTDERLRRAMSAAGCAPGEDLTFVIEPRHKYAAADLTELLVCWDYQCTVLLTDPVDPLGIAARVDALRPDGLVWFLDGVSPWYVSLPPESRIITVSRSGIPSREPRHSDIIHLDPIPYFAFRTFGALYRVCPDQFFLEPGAHNELLVTTLKQDILPLLRFDTGLRVRTVERCGFVLAE